MTFETASRKGYLVNYREPALDPAEFDITTEGASENSSFGPISKVNIFVGANNSGKSRALRALAFMPWVQLVQYSGKKLDAWESYDSITRLRTRVIKWNNARPNNYRNNFDLNAIRNATTINHPEIQKVKNYEDLLSILTEGVEALGKLIELVNTQVVVKSQKDVVDYCFRFIDSAESYIKLARFTLEGDDDGLKYLVGVGATHYQQIESEVDNLSLILGEIVEACPSRNTYLAALRSTYSLVNNGGRKQLENFFGPTIYHSYFSGRARKINQPEDRSKPDIFTGQELFDLVLKARNGSKAERNRIEEFEQFLSVNFFLRKAVEVVAKLIPNSNKDAEKLSFDRSHVCFTIDGEEKDIHDLGDGIQSIIMLTFPIFNAQDNSWIFIEEPETHLHPGLQRQFMEVLLEDKVIKKKNLRFFLTTHSNHLLDLMLTERQDISIFSFREDPISKKKIVKNVLSGDQDLLSHLGVQSSSVFIANCSIWVEGITDRLYMRAYLNAYLEHHKRKTKPIREDLDYAFFEYAGTNLSHYLFAKPSEMEADLRGIKSMRLSNRILVLADQDANKEEKHEALKSAGHGNFLYHFYPGVREVENLLHPAVLQEVLPILFPKLRDGNVDLSTLNHSEYKGKYLGTYLKEKLGEENFTKSDIAESGTIGSTKKLKLAEAACKVIKWKDMTLEAQKLAETIYGFITNSK